MLNDFDVKEILLSIRTLKFENNQIKKYLKLKDEDIFKEENESDYIELDRTNLWKKFKSKKFKNKIKNINKLTNLKRTSEKI